MKIIKKIFFVFTSLFLIYFLGNVFFVTYARNKLKSFIKEKSLKDVTIESEWIIKAEKAEEATLLKGYRIALPLNPSSVFGIKKDYFVLKYKNEEIAFFFHETDSFPFFQGSLGDSLLRNLDVNSSMNGYDVEKHIFNTTLKDLSFFHPIKSNLRVYYLLAAKFFTISEFVEKVYFFEKENLQGLVLEMLDYDKDKAYEVMVFDRKNKKGAAVLLVSETKESDRKKVINTILSHLQYVPEEMRLRNKENLKLGKQHYENEEWEKTSYHLSLYLFNSDTVDDLETELLLLEAYKNTGKDLFESYYMNLKLKYRDDSVLKAIEKVKGSE